MKKILVPVVAATLLLAGAGLATAQMGGGGGGMGGGGGDMGGGMGAGMSMGIIVASDGTAISAGVDDPSSDAPKGTLVAVGPNGSIRWRTSLDEGWPMMVATKGDLVVALAASGGMMSGDGSGSGGGMGGGSGSGGDGGSDMTPPDFTLVAVSLSSGAHLWSVVLDNYMASGLSFTPDGSAIYVTAIAIPQDGSSMMGGASHLLAYGLDGHLLWDVDLTTTPASTAGAPARSRRHS